MFAYFNFKQVFVRSKGLKACGSGFWIIWGDLGVEELFVQIERGKFNIFLGIFSFFFWSNVYIIIKSIYLSECEVILSVLGGGKGIMLKI